MNIKGKVIIKLSELKEGFFVQKEVLIVLRKNGMLEVCKIKKPLTRKELLLLNRDIESGLIKIQKKISKSGPVSVSMENGAIYYHDLMIMKNEGKVVTCLILG